MSYAEEDICHMRRRIHVSYTQGRKAMTGERFGPEFSMLDNPFYYLPCQAQRMLSILVVHFEYGLLLLWPTNLSADYSFDCIPPARGLSLCPGSYPFPRALSTLPRTPSCSAFACKYRASVNTHTHGDRRDGGASGGGGAALRRGAGSRLRGSPSPPRSPSRAPTVCVQRFALIRCTIFIYVWSVTSPCDEACVSKPVVEIAQPLSVLMRCPMFIYVWSLTSLCV